MSQSRVIDVYPVEVGVPTEHECVLTLIVRNGSGRKTFNNLTLTREAASKLIGPALMPLVDWVKAK